MVNTVDQETINEVKCIEQEQAEELRKNRDHAHRLVDKHNIQFVDNEHSTDVFLDGNLEGRIREVMNLATGKRVWVYKQYPEAIGVPDLEDYKCQVQCQVLAKALDRDTRQ